MLYTFYLVIKYDVKAVKIGRNYHFVLLLVFVILLVGFSYRLGLDTVGYMKYYDGVDSDLKYVISHIYEYRYEPIITLLLSFCKNIGVKFFVIQFIIAIFVNSVIFLFFRKYSKYYFFCILLYFIFQGWNINFEIKRESIAIAFWLIAMDKYLSNENSPKKYIYYYVWCIPAMLSHKFAFITLFYPLIMNVKLNKKMIYIIIITSLLVFLNIPFVSVIFSKMNFLFAFFGGEEVVTEYLNNNRYGTGEITIFGYIQYVLMPLVIIWSVKKVTSNSVIFALAIISVFITILQSQIFICYRLKNYLFFFLIIIYSEFLRECYTNRKSLPQKIILTAIIILALLPKFQKSQYIRYAPYCSIFTKEYNTERELEYNRLDYLINY